MKLDFIYPSTPQANHWVLSSFKCCEKLLWGLQQFNVMYIAERFLHFCSNSNYLKSTMKRDYKLNKPWKHQINYWYLWLWTATEPAQQNPNCNASLSPLAATLRRTTFTQAPSRPPITRRPSRCIVLYLITLSYRECEDSWGDVTKNAWTYTT